MDTFTARTPVDLLAVVPYLIGFHPEDSVVMLTFAGEEPDRAQEVAATFHARVDLPLDDADREQVAGLLREVAVRHRAGRVALVLYTEDGGAARDLADLLVPDLLRSGIEVIDVIRTDGDSFYCVEDDDDPGTAYDLAAHPFTAAQVLRGRVAYRSRAALSESLVGSDEEDAARVDAAARATIDELIRTAQQGLPLSVTMVEEARWIQATVRGLVEDGGEPSVQEAGRLLVLVAFEALREVAWSEMSRATAPRHVEVWRDLVRRAPLDLRAGVGGLLGFAAWLAGDGALAWCALDRCFESDPTDQLGQHAAALVESATPPSVWSPVPAESLRVFQVEEGRAC